MNVNIIVDKIEPYIEYAVSFLNDSFCKDNKFLLFTFKDYKKNENISIVYSENSSDINIDYQIFIPKDNHPELIKTFDFNYDLDENKKCFINKDIFRYVFERLTLKYEYDFEKNHGPIGSLSTRYENDLYDLKSPSVDIIISALLELLKQYSNENEDINLSSPYPENKAFAICLTHDIDTIDKSFKMLLKQTRHFLYRTKKHLGNIEVKKSLHEIKNIMEKYFSKLDYWQFPHLLELEKKYETTSTYNFFVKTPKNSNSFKQYLYNPEYDIEKNSMIINIFNEIEKNSSEIAIHGSYNSYNDKEMLSEEIEKLKNIAKVDNIFGIRQHFLQYVQYETQLNHYSNNFIYDTSLGFRDINGFRAGTSKPFYYYDHKKNEKINILEIPLVIMDGVLFDREFSKYDDALKSVEEILTTVKKYNGACSILWHNHVFNEKVFPRWGEIYEYALSWVKGENGWMGSSKDFINNSRYNNTI